MENSVEKKKTKKEQVQAGNECGVSQELNEYEGVEGEGIREQVQDK